ncbi:SCO4225 family membrane protein [Streptomyces sp. NPDC059575]|uniref:SCO4225 family membrane protein n=1 Tax=Streptomyces sp. NPDC059575 TaxID=3346872 RepID=UPI00367DB787
MPNPSSPCRLLALATSHWLPRGHLAAFVTSALAMFLFPTTDLAWIPTLLTAPLSFLTAFLPFGPGSGLDTQAGVLANGVWVALLFVCALVNSAVLGHIVTRSATTASEFPSRSPAPLAPRGTDGSQPAGSRRHRLRTLLAPALDNWLARAYLTVVAVALAYFIGVTWVGPDSGYSAAYSLIVTGPLGILVLAVSIPTEFLPVAWVHPVVFSAATILAGLFNAVFIGRFAHTLRTRARR